MGDELRIKGTRRKEQGRVVVGKVDALLLQAVQVGGVLGVKSQVSMDSSMTMMRFLPSKAPVISFPGHLLARSS